MISRLRSLTDKQKRWLEFPALLVVGLIVYGNSIGGEFTYDDLYNVRENPFVHDLRFFWSYFTDSRTLSALPENAPYRPLSTLSFALLWWIGQGATWVFDLHKIFLHVFTAWLCSIVIAERLCRSSALNVPRWVLWLSALFFVIHPSLSEPVNYISSLTSVQCGLLLAGGFWAFLERRYFLMALLAFASMLTKEEGVIFPALLMLYSWVFQDRKRWRGHLHAWAVFFIYLVIRHFLGSKTVVFGVVPWHEYFFTQLRAWVYYIYKIVTPWGYSVEHTWFGFSKSLFEPRVLGSLALIGWMAWKTFRWVRPIEEKDARPFLAFGWGWYLLCLLPASSVFALAEPINEHRYYLSFMILFPALVVAAWQARDSVLLKSIPDALKRVALAAVVIVFASVTVSQNPVWQNDELLWQDVLEKDPTNGRAMNNLGVEIMQRGGLAEALELFQRSERTLGPYKYALINQVICLVGLNRVAEAREVMKKLTTVSDDPDSVVVHYQHAKFLLEVERSAETAIPVLERCHVVSQRKYLPCLILQIWAYQATKQTDAMLRLAEEALRIDPDNREASFGLGMALIELGNQREALKVFEELLTRNPQDLQSLHNAAWLRMQLGEYREAKVHLEQKLQLTPGDPATLNSLNFVMEKLGEKK